MVAVAIGAEQGDSGSKPNYQLIGIGIGVLGVVVAALIGWFMVKPAWEKNQEQTNTIEELVNQIEEKAEEEKAKAEKTMAEVRKEELLFISDKALETLKAKEEKAKAQRAIAQRRKEEVTALFASEKALETLLLDLNRIVDARKAEMNLFKPSNSGPPEVISDGSLGPLVNGKLKQKEMKMELTGSFDQIRSVLLTMERLQPLLVVKDFRTRLDRSTQEVRYNQGRLTISGSPKLNTSLTIQALMPAELP